MRKSPYDLSKMRWTIFKNRPYHGDYVTRPATKEESDRLNMENEYLTPKERAQKEHPKMKTVTITVKADSYWAIAKMLHEVARKIWFEAWPTPLESQTGISNSKPPFVPATHGHHLNEDNSSIQWYTIVDTDAREGSTGARW